MLRFLTNLFKSTPPVARNKSNGAVSDDYIAASWRAAQSKLAAGLDAEQAKHFRVAPLTGFPRALTCWPGGVEVYVVEDILYAELVPLCASLGVPITRTTGDPTGVWYAGGKKFLSGQSRFSLFGGTDVKFVRSRPYVLEHEFMHVILRRIGAV